jgi:hypothetical protein
MRVEFTITSSSVPDAQVAENIAHSRSLGLPIVARRAGGRALNVIGRGPSVARYVDEIRSSDADNFAAGTSWAWCRDNGIQAALVCLDPHPRMADYVKGCEVAICHPQCAPAVFATLGGADVKLIAPEHEECGSTAALLAIAVGAVPGCQIRLYGCEGSYEERTHADEDVPQPNEMFIRADGRVFRTNTQMLIQSQQLAELFRLAPDVFVDRSGGLLGALIASGGDWDMLRWDNAPPEIAALLNTGNPGWGDDGAADWQARAAE